MPNPTPGFRGRGQHFGFGWRLLASSCSCPRSTRTSRCHPTKGVERTSPRGDRRRPGGVDGRRGGPRRGDGGRPLRGDGFGGAQIPPGRQGRAESHSCRAVSSLRRPLPGALRSGECLARNLRCRGAGRRELAAAGIGRGLGAGAERNRHRRGPVEARQRRLHSDRQAARPRRLDPCRSSGAATMRAPLAQCAALP